MSHVLYELHSSHVFRGVVLRGLQIRGVAQRINAYNPEPWMDSNIIIVPQLQKVFEL